MSIHIARYAASAAWCCCAAAAGEVDPVDPVEEVDVVGADELVAVTVGAVEAGGIERRASSEQPVAVTASRPSSPSRQSPRSDVSGVVRGARGGGQGVIRIPDHKDRAVTKTTVITVSEGSAR
jgi:hypothetical protein